MIGPWREMLTTTVKCPCGQKGRWQRMTKVYEDSEPEWEHSCDRCMFAGSGGTEGRANSGGAATLGARREARTTPGARSGQPASGVACPDGERPSFQAKTSSEPVSSPARSRKDRKPLPAPIEQKACSRCGIVFRGYREHCVKCRRWGEPGRPPIPESEKALNPGQSKA